MWNARLDAAQAGIKIAKRNRNYLRYADNIILMAECKEELKSHLMKVKEESEKDGLNLNFQNLEKVEIVTDFIFMGSKITADGDCSHEIKICNCFHFFPFYLPWNDRIRCSDLSFLNVEF